MFESLNSYRYHLFNMLNNWILKHIECTLKYVVLNQISIVMCTLKGCFYKPRHLEVKH